MVVGLGAGVTILDRDPDVLERLGVHFESRAKTRFANPAQPTPAAAGPRLLLG